MSDQVAHLEHMLHQLARPMSHLIMKVEKIQDIVVDSRYDKILQWISPIQSVSRHQVIKRRHMEGTGGWLFRNPVFDDWQESTESAFLWLQGESQFEFPCLSDQNFRTADQMNSGVWEVNARVSRG